VAFGERVGGTPTYIGQQYNFGVYAGIPYEPITVIVSAYTNIMNGTNARYAGETIFAAPNLQFTNQFNVFLTNGFQITGTNYDVNGAVTTNNFGLNTVLSYTPALTWGATVATGYAYDPQVEFLELGVQYGLNPVWKLYGPDLNGKYGGLNGVGGLEGFSPAIYQFVPTISDARGNVLAEVTNGVVAWSPSRLTGYGAVPDYRPVALANGADIGQSSAWRGRWPDITGYCELGLRPYDPISGRWLTYDAVWNEFDPNCYTFTGGDPINGFDSDGRINVNYYLNGSDQNNFSVATTQPILFSAGGDDSLADYIHDQHFAMAMNYISSTSPRDSVEFDEVLTGQRDWDSLDDKDQMLQQGLQGALSTIALVAPILDIVGLPELSLATDAGESSEFSLSASSDLADTTIISDQGAPSSRQIIAQSFMKINTPLNDDTISKFIQGIDLEEEVQVVTIPAGTPVVQYQVPGAATGYFFAPLGTPANMLGIDASGRIGNIYVTTQDTTVLQSTAADTSGMQNLPPSARGPGGGTQYFAPDNSVFIRNQ
jgi:RHS repeat-associated protein